MQETENLVWIGHITNPCIPRRIFKTIAKAGDHEDDYENWVRRMHCNYNIGKQMAAWRYESDTPLAEFEVNGVIEKRRRYVTDQRRQKN